MSSEQLNVQFRKVVKYRILLIKYNECALKANAIELQNKKYLLANIQFTLLKA